VTTLNSNDTIELQTELH